ncbi:hydrogenase maturation nickel metallochaperone HypA/HybF [Lignipirellula cremea]|uniref:Hydrogenase maturation factor HypA n=1 Tax=Lignipirellula cremea TaxID=2528010 RepID=A0A518E4Z6_9BACT|nr:hydrogenase maturation nickel metallochaperone HypA [Lignipirellula cremea]QDU99171.1 hydrogenase nickel incorporation protein [Lignipirellula cremea]
MHELSIALSILDIAAEESAQRDGAAIRAIHIRLGPLSGVVNTALLSAFELARESCPWGDVRLVVEETPLRIFCEACQCEQTVASIQLMCCPVCDRPSGDIRSGREMEIVAMEIEDPSAVQPHEASP